MSITQREQALAALAASDPEAKMAAVDSICDAAEMGVDAVLAAPQGLPGRPARPELVAPSRVAQRSVQTPEGRAALVHALAHIEFNAVNLALDAVWRYAGMPLQFYRDWLRVAREEARHFRLLNDHLRGMGHGYGDFPAHDGLWSMAEKTRGDLLARLALVPRTLEARGLDASPLIRHKLASAGDKAGAKILDIILADEIGHVAIGNHWYRWMCERQGLDPVETYATLASRYDAPQLKGPFNLAARREAGFTEEEIALLAVRPDPGLALQDKVGNG